MQCSKCGCQMHGKETTCACCGRVHSSNSDFSAGRTPPANHRDGQKALAVSVCVAVLIALALAFGAWVVSARQAKQKAALQEAREVRLAATLVSLRAAHPAASFDRYPGDNNSLAFQAQLSTCDVRGLTFSRTDGSDTLTVNVSLLGYKPDHQAPTVYVALYGEDGTLLAEKAIVRFVNAEMEQGETREVKDTLDYPKNGVPLFVGVSDEAAIITPASVAASYAGPPPTDAAPAPASALSDKERADQEIKEGQARWTADKAANAQAQGKEALGGEAPVPCPAPRPYAQVMSDWINAEPQGMVITWPYGDKAAMRMDLSAEGASPYEDADFARSMALAFMEKRLDAGFKARDAANCRLVFCNTRTGDTLTTTPDVSAPQMQAVIDQATASGH